MLPGADVIMEVILSWKESDVACRDILYVKLYLMYRLEATHSKGRTFL